LYVISKLCLRFSTIVCDTQFTLIVFFCLFWTNVQSKRTTRAEPEDHLWSADHSLRSIALYQLVVPSVNLVKHCSYKSRSNNAGYRIVVSGDICASIKELVSVFTTCCNTTEFVKFVCVNLYTAHDSQNKLQLLLQTDLTKWLLEWRRTVFSVRYKLNFMYFLYEIIFKINQQISICLPLHQVITSHYSSVLILIMLLAGRVG
jgi:hypothetical protein